MLVSPRLVSVPGARSAGHPLTPGVLLSAIVFLGSLPLGGCGDGDSAAGGHAGGSHGPGRNGGGGPSALPTVPVAVESARRGEIASYYSTTATLEASREAEILARVNG